MKGCYSHVFSTEMTGRHLNLIPMLCGFTTSLTKCWKRRSITGKRKTWNPVSRGFWDKPRNVLQPQSSSLSFLNDPRSQQSTELLSCSFKVEAVDFIRELSSWLNHHLEVCLSIPAHGITQWSTPPIKTLLTSASRNVDLMQSSTPVCKKL